MQYETFPFTHDNSPLLFSLSPPTSWAPITSKEKKEKRTYVAESLMIAVDE